MNFEANFARMRDIVTGEGRSKLDVPKRAVAPIWPCQNSVGDEEVGVHS